MEVWGQITWTPILRKSDNFLLFIDCFGFVKVGLRLIVIKNVCVRKLKLGKVIGKIARSFALVFSALVAAYLAAKWINNNVAVSVEELRLFRLVSLGLVAWAVLGKSGAEIETWELQSMSEHFNSIWFNVLYFVGFFCGGLALLVIPK